MKCFNALYLFPHPSTHAAGVSYKGRSQYSVGPDLRKGAVILDMGPNIVQDPKYIKEASVQFSSPDNTDIGITEDGKIYVRNEIQNWQNWFRFTVQVRGIGQKDRKFEWRQDYSVRLNIHSEFSLCINLLTTVSHFSGL